MGVDLFAYVWWLSSRGVSLASTVDPGKDEYETAIVIPEVYLVVVSSPSLGYATSTIQPLHASPLSPFPRCSRGGSQHCAAVSCAKSGVALPQL